MIPFKKYHLLQILDQFDPQKGPIDFFMSLYFRKNRALGSKDKAYISETIYQLIRKQTLLNHLSNFTSDWNKKLELLEKLDVIKIDQFPLHVQLSFPKSIFEKIMIQYGLDLATKICRAMNGPAPTTVRVNTLKISRDELFEKWKDKYAVVKSSESALGITFLQKIHFYSMPEFQEGLFEIQDEASQLVALHVEAKPQDQVLDYCAGSGGKTLAFAPLLKGQGQIYLHDIRTHILIEAKRRLKRAGIQNAQILSSTDAVKQKKLKKKMDWVLVDAPCSGSGTWRRNPDMKEKFHEENLVSLVKEQRNIFERALSFVKPEGKIVYATCSLFQEENELQAQYFEKKFNLKLTSPYFHSLPEPNKMDGFFCAVFKKSAD